MYQFRWGQAQDLPWLDQAVAAGAWEALSPQQRTTVSPATAALQAQMQLRQVLSAPGCAVIVAQLDAQPAGYLLYAIAPDSSTDEPTAHLVDLWIVPAHRRRGAGTGLLRAAEQLTTAQGLRKLKLWTGLHNQPVVAFAERHGFTPAGLIGVKDL